VEILDDQHHRATTAHLLAESRKDLSRCSACDTTREDRPGCLRDVEEGCERSRCVEGVAAAPPGEDVVLLAEYAHERRLSDSRLSRDESDAAPSGCADRRRRIVKRLQLGRALEQLRHAAKFDARGALLRIGPHCTDGGLSRSPAPVDEDRMRPLLTGLVLVVAAATSAANATPGAVPNPCKLVTATDVKAVLGTPVARGKLQSLGLYQSCTYTTKSLVTVTVQTRTLSKADFVKSAKANPPPVKAVAGVGAPAYYAGGATLLVWRRGNEATFSIFGGGPGLAREVKLAKRVVKRL